MKKYIQEEQSKKTRTKPRRDVRLACLANFSTEGRGKKSSKEGIFDDDEFYQARKCLEARNKRLKKSKATETIQTQLKRGKHHEKYLH